MTEESGNRGERLLEAATDQQQLARADEGVGRFHDTYPAPGHEDAVV